jgi:hypothetical protein
MYINKIVILIIIIIIIKIENDELGMRGRRRR